MMARIKAFLDKYTEKFVSRKFLVFIIATVGWTAGILSEDNWAALSLGYVGIQGFTDLAVVWKGSAGKGFKPME